MTNRRTFLKRLGIGTLGGAIVAKAVTEARIPATGPTTRLPEPEPEPVISEPLWFEVAAPTSPMTVQYWIPATTAIPLRASGGSFITHGATDLWVGNGDRESVTPAYCGKCRQPLPLGANYCIYCASEVA
jgi:hypothetical protein